jgi:fumarylacetoacetate (FAA) hydrolase
MKLASLSGGHDGRLVVVSADLTRYVAVPQIAATLQAALDDWDACAPQLQAVADALEAGRSAGEALDLTALAPPLPRAYQWCEGSSYLVHLERTRASTGRVLPPELYRDPGVWQGTSNHFVAAHDAIPVCDDAWDIDLEPSVAVITGQVPMGTPPEQAARYIRLVVLLNDVSLRAIQIPEMAKGLGVLQSKPLKVFAPVAVTPAGLGAFWTGSMLARQVVVHVNGERIGDPWAHRDHEFDFPRLIAHVARTRVIGAGSIVSCGTVANRDAARGSTCLMERRALEIVADGQARTPYLRFGDSIAIDCHDDAGRSIFGPMHNRIERA